MKEDQTSRARASASPNGPPATYAPRRILVVEDDSSLRKLCSQVLTNSGYYVDTAADGALAWETLQLNRYDLVVTDNNMPNVTGVELLKKLRAARMALPVIMATGAFPTQEFAHRPWLAPNASLLKPYTAPEMLATVKKVLGETDDRTVALRSQPRAAHRILVVDEDRDSRLLYADALTPPHYYVDLAEDGHAGWDALQAHPYEMLIAEHDMPKLSGLELVRRVRAAHMALPIVLTARNLPTDELARASALQFAATLRKPFAVNDLLHTVQNVLRANANPSEPDAPPITPAGLNF